MLSSLQSVVVCTVRSSISTHSVHKMKRMLWSPLQVPLPSYVCANERVHVMLGVTFHILIVDSELCIY